MKRVLIARLVGVIGVAFVAAAFVMLYSKVSDYRFIWEHKVHSVLGIAYWLAEYSVYGFILPLVVALLGIPCLLKTPPRRTLFEITIWVGLVASLVWIGLALIYWQGANIPQIGLKGERY